MLTYAVFSDKGDRPYNEDSTVCCCYRKRKAALPWQMDLGGQGKGDVASKFVVEEDPKEIMTKEKNHCHEKFITEMAE
ncbi:MAG: hypothetical protein ACLTJ5_14720 [Clostridium sp.]